MHQISKKTSGSPFSKSKGARRMCLLHPSKPLFLVATMRHVRIYHLIQQQEARKLHARRQMDLVHVRASGRRR